MEKRSMQASGKVVISEMSTNKQEGDVSPYGQTTKCYVVSESDVACISWHKKFDSIGKKIVIKKSV